MGSDFKNGFRVKTTRHDPQIKIRLPPLIKQKIELEAKRHGRSRITEILVRLVESFHIESGREGLISNEK